MRPKYFIAVCDILGFSDLVRDNDLDFVVEHSVGWFRKSLNHSVHKIKFPTEIPPTEDLDKHPKIGVAWLSDTVLFYTKEDTDESIQELLSTVAWLLFETISEGRTKVRGALAYGEAFIDAPNSLYVGTPIIEAYSLEQEQQWSGAALTQSAIDRLPPLARSGEYADWWLVPYDVPLKNKSSQNTLAVNWNQGIHHPSWRLRWSKSSDLPLESDWKDKPSVCEKFVNTKIFHELHCFYCGGGAPPRTH
jgi:hypothetical protein